MDGNIRKSDVTDLEQLTEIYNQAILTKRCTCDMEVFSTEQRHEWFNEHQNERYPVWVFEADRKVIGYASLSPYRTGRKALSNVCEISYYVDFYYHRNGIGTRLIDFTLKEAKIKGFRNAIAILLDCNISSIGLLKKFGFCEWGKMPEIAEFDDSTYSHLYFGRKL